MEMTLETGFTLTDLGRAAVYNFCAALPDETDTCPTCGSTEYGFCECPPSTNAPKLTLQDFTDLSNSDMRYDR